MAVANPATAAAQPRRRRRAGLGNLDELPPAADGRARTFHERRARFEVRVQPLLAGRPPLMRAFVAEDEPRRRCERLRERAGAAWRRCCRWWAGSVGVQGTRAGCREPGARPSCCWTSSSPTGLSLELFADGTLLPPPSSPPPHDRSRSTPSGAGGGTCSDRWPTTRSAFGASRRSLALPELAPTAALPARARRRHQRLPWAGRAQPARFAARPRGLRHLGRRGPAAVADGGARYARSTRPLETLQAQLDPRRWFPRHRALLMSLRAVRRFVPASRGPAARGDCSRRHRRVPSARNQAAAFRAWMRGWKPAPRAEVNPRRRPDGRWRAPRRGKSVEWRLAMEREAEQLGCGAWRQGAGGLVGMSLPACSQPGGSCQPARAEASAGLGSDPSCGGHQDIAFARPRVMRGSRCGGLCPEPPRVGDDANCRRMQVRTGRRPGQGAA